MGQRDLVRGVEGLLTLGVLCLSTPAAFAAEAPRGNPWPASWASGNKEAFGTSYEAYDSDNVYSSRSASAPISKLWFTGAQGVLSEVFWPTLDRKQIRDLQFLVSDGTSFFFEERTQGRSVLSWIESGVPAFRIVTRDAGNRFEIEKIFYTDPRRDTFLKKTIFRAFVPGLKLYALINPMMANTPYGDNATVTGDALMAWQGSEALALLSSTGFRKVSAGHSGSLDPFQDLARDLSFDNSFATAIDGDVVMMGELELPSQVGTYSFDLALGFGDTIEAARETALRSLAEADAALDRYTREWRTYQARISSPKLRVNYSESLFRASIAVLKSLEDKTFPGAFVASPSVPWGLIQVDNSRKASARHTQMTRADLPLSEHAQGVGGYHLVWPRDLYQMAESFLAIGDVQSAKASLEYLKRIQYRDVDGFWDYGNRRFSKAGSFLQNSWLHGESHWRMLQMDQTAYPALLAARLWRLGAVDFEEIRELMSLAAGFIEANGPWTFQERWEENMGASPSTLSVQIAALRESSDVFRAQGDVSRAERYAKRASEWEGKLDEWTYTRSGPKGNGSYYLRVVGTERPDSPWNPNSNAMIRITNGGPLLLEKSVIDGGFLELVRYGVRRAWSSLVRSTLAVYDAELRFTTSRGVGFKRYTADAYNWDEGTGRQTQGMIWPFLSGERAHYELSSLEERRDTLSSEGLGSAYQNDVVPHLKSFESFATPSFMLPEQVWDSGPRQGLPTGAATPLGWAHGEYVRLLRDMESFERRSLTPKARGL